MNYFHHFFPSLLRLPGFLLEFITPIVKATKGTKSEIFYTMPEYEAWKESLGHNLRGWSIKYYKGLGTSTAKEAKEYFANLGEQASTSFPCPSTPHLLSFYILTLLLSGMRHRRELTTRP